MAIDKRSQIRRMQALFITRVMNNFYGEIIIKFEHGNVVFVKELTNLRPNQEETVKDIIDNYLANEDLEDVSELLIKKVKGKPHLAIINKGTIAQTVPVQTIEEAEKFRNKA